MAEPPPLPDADRGTPPRMPRWVRVAAIVVGLLILLFVVLRLTGLGGEHGPGRHMSGSPGPAVPMSAASSPATGTAG